MAEITEPLLVNFLGDMRTLSNSIYQWNNVMEEHADRYINHGIGNALMELEPTDTIADGAQVNGWAVATVQDMQTFAFRVQQMLDVLRAEFAMDIINKLRTQGVT